MAKAFWNFTRVRQLACSVYARGTSVPMFLVVTDGDLSLVWIAPHSGRSAPNRSAAAWRTSSWSSIGDEILSHFGRAGGNALSFRRVPRGVALKEADDTPQFPHQLQGPVIGMFEKARRHKAYEIAALALLARNLEAHCDGARG